ncbi:MAG: hypothetical protein HN350_10265 [Phycisphaerales bacterium]|jgi:hypothetical protein|nr:hypothetical protein [Phycisphaerales bacterium]
MKYAVIITLWAVMLVCGCGSKTEDPPREADASTSLPEKSPNETDPITDHTEPDDDDPPARVRAPGFFGGSSSGTRAEQDSYTQKKQPIKPIEPIEPIKPVEPIKRPEIKPVTPDQRVSKQIKLARLYIANASSGSESTRRTLNSQAVAILKKVIAEHPQAENIDEARKLLGEIETTQ